MFERRIIHERELSKKDLDYQEIMDFLKDAELMKTMSDIGPCYEKLVKEFIVNISNECKIEGRKGLMKVHVRGYCVKLSPKIINEY